MATLCVCLPAYDCTAVTPFAACVCSLRVCLYVCMCVCVCVCEEGLLPLPIAFALLIEANYGSQHLHLRLSHSK
jgi:hypothetical protein